MTDNAVKVLLEGADQIARDRDNVLLITILKILLEIERIDNKEAKIKSIENFIKVIKEEIDKLKESK